VESQHRPTKSKREGRPSSGRKRKHRKKRTSAPGVQRQSGTKQSTTEKSK
jgi:hypothetical protein